MIYRLEAKTCDIHTFRLSNNSMNQETFNEATGPYDAALKENRHSYILKYRPNHTMQENSRANSITEELNVAEPNQTECQKKEETQEQEK